MNTLLMTFALLCFLVTIICGSGLVRFRSETLSVLVTWIVLLAGICAFGVALSA